MGRYLLIESRDPFESNDVGYFQGLAADLAGAGNQVTLFLVQNGVLPARAGCQGNGLEKAARAGVKILADDFSLAERAIGDGALKDAVTKAPLDVVIDQMAAGAKTIWH